MSDIGHNNPPETIEEIVRAAQQTKDLMEMAKDRADKAAAPWNIKAQEASAPHRAEQQRLDDLYRNRVAQIARWQEKQRRANPFADAKEVARVIIDGEVAVTSRETQGFEIIKADMVPRDLCKPDDAKIKAKLALSEDEVPGVRRTVKYGTVVR